MAKEGKRSNKSVENRALRPRMTGGLEGSVEKKGELHSVPSPCLKG